MLHAAKLRLLAMLHRHRRNPLVRRIGSIARTIHYYFEHPGYDLVTNGESGVLRTLQGADLRSVLDVGANRGEWSALLFKHHPAAQVHLFEIAPPTFAHLVQKLGSDARTTLHPHGLGLRDETIPVHYYPGQDGLTSAAWHMHQRESQVIDGRVRRGDSWAAEAGVEGADYLKIDVEGMELEVLQGFGRLITEARFRFIQFEHHGGRHLLHDYYQLLAPAGYQLGKIYSNYVDFQPYSQRLEDGIGPNYLAVRSDQKTALQNLASGWKN